jgi:hypothetical protein
MREVGVDACFFLEKKKMIRTTVQRGIAFAQIGRAAITAMVILLLCVPPAWAATLCNCQAEIGSLHACCLASENGRAEIKVSAHCQNTQSSSSNFQVQKSSQPAVSCCEASPQRELENAELSLAVTIAAEANSPLPIDCRKHLPQAPPSINKLPRQSQRPLYLAFSCWLI